MPYFTKKRSGKSRGKKEKVVKKRNVSSGSTEKDSGSHGKKITSRFGAIWTIFRRNSGAGSTGAVGTSSSGKN